MAKLAVIFHNALKAIGIDKSIAYASGARIIQAFTGVLSIFFVAQFLTKSEQGFYYTFGSIIAIQVFFELGLTNIITQYVAHEASHLYWKDSFSIEGNQKNLSRLAYLVKFSIKWYAAIGILFFIVLIIVGYIFFYYYSPKDDDISWKIPWILVCIGTMINLFISPLLSILMGLEKIKEVMKMRFYQQLIIPVSTWIGLIIGFHLYVLGIASLLSVLYVVIYSRSTGLQKILINLYKIPISHKIDYLKEIFPFQWKIALSWISGYFIFQLFNPVLFATEGPIIAGQMGMTLSVINGISSFSQSWVSTKIPLWSKLIALKDYIKLDQIFNKTMKQLSFICLSLILIFISGLWILQLFDIKLGYRFLSWIPLLFMLCALFLNQWINGWATYLRCHKKEPFLVISIVSGILCCLSTLILGKIYGVIGMSAGYCIITVIIFIWSFQTFKTCKLSWHES